MSAAVVLGTTTTSTMVAHVVGSSLFRLTEVAMMVTVTAIRKSSISYSSSVIQRRSLTCGMGLCPGSSASSSSSSSSISHAV